DRSALALQFHVETTPGLVEGLVEHCAAEIVPGTSVQSAAELSARLPERCAALEPLLEPALMFLHEAPGEATSRRRGSAVLLLPVRGTGARLPAPGCPFERRPGRRRCLSAQPAGSWPARLPAARSAFVPPARRTNRPSRSA